MRGFFSIVDNLMIEMRENLIEFVGVLISSGMVMILHASSATQNLMGEHRVIEQMPEVLSVASKKIEKGVLPAPCKGVGE